MTQEELNKLKKGDKCKIVNDTSGHSFPMGEIVKFGNMDTLEGRLSAIFTTLDDTDYWWVYPEDVEKI
jgi:hypothetical protein